MPPAGRINLRWRLPTQDALDRQASESSAAPSVSRPLVATCGVRAQLYDAQERLRAKEGELEAALKREQDHRLRAEDLERHNGGLRLRIEALLRDVVVGHRQAEELRGLAGIRDGGQSLWDQCAPLRG